MQNNDPKSENAAMKERAAKDKDKHGREHNTVPHQHGPAQAGHGPEINKDAEPKNVRPGSHPVE
jgi:hypothetical protein